MNNKIKILICAVIVITLAGVSYAAISPVTTIVVKYQGQTRITDMINSNDSTKMAGILTSESDTVLKFVSFPYQIPETNITVIKYRCDFVNQYCGFWINATRNGQSIRTNSPVWISPPPYLVYVSENYDEKKDILTITVREDPATATGKVLQNYVDQCPLGEPITGTTT